MTLKFIKRNSQAKNAKPLNTTVHATSKQYFNLNKVLPVTVNLQSFAKHRVCRNRLTQIRKGNKS